MTKLTFLVLRRKVTTESVANIVMPEASHTGCPKA